MQRIASFLFLISFPCSAVAQDAGLELKGDVVIVKIDKVIVVKEDRTLVRSLPVTVTAPKGAAGYWWSVPAGVTAIDKGDALDISAAPKGELTIRVKILVVDFERKVTTNTTGAITFNVGDVGPIPPLPPDPKPPGPAPTPLTKTFQAAYDADLDADKAAKLAKYIDILDGAVTVAKASGKVKSAGDFYAAIHAATEASVGPLATSIPTVRRAVGGYLQTVLPRDAKTPADESYFARVASEHGYVVLTLKGLTR